MFVRLCSTGVVFVVIAAGISASAEEERFDISGHSLSGGQASGEVRTINDWCGLAIAAKSERARNQYAALLLAIEKEVREVRQGQLGGLDKVAIRRAALALIESGPYQARIDAMQALAPLADESCIPALLSTANQPVDANGRLDYQAIGWADSLLAKIGDKKAIAGLVAMARARIPEISASSSQADFQSQQSACQRAELAVKVLGSMDSAEADAALKGLRKLAGKTTAWNMSSDVEAAIKAVEERVAAKENAKAAEKKNEKR